MPGGLLGLTYALAVAVADGLAVVPWPGEGKVIRALRARRGLVERFEEWARTSCDPSRPLLWIHAPSVGEGLQAKPVIERLRARRPELQVVYTYFSPSAEAFAASLDVDLAAYLPFDSHRAAVRLLDALRPDAIVFAKLDLWPTLAAEASARHVALGMISATLSRGSGRRSPIARALLHEAYAALSAVGSIDAADAERLAAIGVPAARISITGDTRYDQVAARAAATDRSSAVLAPLASSRPTVVAGSTWPADEMVLLRAWLDVLREVPRARVIIAPHEPTEAHRAPIRAWAERAGLACAELAAANASHDVVLVDRVGVLGELYALGDAAYVGGGFHAAGLHSVLEPAAFGAPVVFGPRHEGSRDAGLLIDAHAGESVASASELARALRILLTESDTRERAGGAARLLVQQGLGAADRSTALVEGLLDRIRERGPGS